MKPALEIQGFIEGFKHPHDVITRDFPVPPAHRIERIERWAHGVKAGKLAGIWLRSGFFWCIFCLIAFMVWYSHGVDQHVARCTNGKQPTPAYCHPPNETGQNG